MIYGRRMRCPYCGGVEDRVVDSRESRERDAIRRRRQCVHCERRFTSYERVERMPRFEDVDAFVKELHQLK